jgi:DNA-directed RNA polymerase specialized sigma24 family protein
VFILDHSAGENIFRIRTFCLASEINADQTFNQIRNDYSCSHPNQVYPTPHTPYPVFTSSTPLNQERPYPWLLFFLEDQKAKLWEEVRIEQQKYSLTDRETEILQYLLQACTYQEIANLLQVSLNTVKFHAKNIYAKKRGYLESKTIYFEL